MEMDDTIPLEEEDEEEEEEEDDVEEEEEEALEFIACIKEAPLDPAPPSKAPHNSLLYGTPGA
jgi:hypothetical protein